MKTGFRHESNGQADDLSRSTNYIYINPIFVFYSEKSKLGIAITPKLWARYDNSAHNHDLGDYRGNSEIGITLGKADGTVLSSTLGWARKGSSIKIDLSYPAARYFSNNINVYFNAQYVNTLAEGLLHYQERTEALRLGLCFVR
jgi:phospholipase A1